MQPEHLIYIVCLKVVNGKIIATDIVELLIKSDKFIISQIYPTHSEACKILLCIRKIKFISITS